MMELNEKVVPSTKNLSGSVTLSLESGNRIQLRYWKNDEEVIMDEVVPKGKIWTSNVLINIDEADA